ncbi:MAG: DNA polymerase III subunit beta [Dehalococcoidia bacterium]|nr:DNA polymerase III subunit beta [Dehalococcoidia bacterium]
MRVVIDRKALIGAVESLLPCTSKGHEVIKSIRLQAGKGVLVGTATNLSESLDYTAKANILAKGETLVLEPRTLRDFLKAVTEAKVTLITTRKVSADQFQKDRKITTCTLEVVAGSTKGTFQAQDAKEFPPTPGVKAQPVALLDLAEAIGRVQYAMLRDENRPALAGLYLEPDRGGSHLVASDGFRLAITTLKTRGKPPVPVILPRGVVALLSKMQGTVRMATDVKTEHHTTKTWRDGVSVDETLDTTSTVMRFTCGNVALTCRGVNSTFPNYKQLIPAKGTPLTVDRSALLEAVKTIGAMKPLSDNVRLQTKGKKLIVWGMTEGAGRVEKAIAARGKARIGFNLHYLRDMLNSQTGPFVLRTDSGSHPAFTKDKVSTHVLMPVFAKWDDGKAAPVFNGVTTANPVATTPVPVAAGAGL